MRSTNSRKSHKRLSTEGPIRTNQFVNALKACKDDESQTPFGFRDIQDTSNFAHLIGQHTASQTPFG